MKIKIFKVFLVFAVLLVLITCQRDKNPLAPTTNERPIISLRANYVGCSEVYLSISTGGATHSPAVTADSLIVLRDQIKIFKTAAFKATAVDTAVWDTALFPNRNYSYKAELWESGKKLAVSPILDVTTMDTTSHDYNWDIKIFPNYNASTLYDVAIVDEGDIWAVGEIYADPNSVEAYNAVHWNGQEWQLKKMQFKYEYIDTVLYINIQPRCVFSFPTGEVLFGGNGLFSWNTDNSSIVKLVEIPQTVWGPVLINKIWGISSSDFYIVGDNGNIAHYDNGNWKKIVGNNTQPLQDIWGGDWGKEKIYSTGAGKIFKIQKKEIKLFPWLQGRKANSIWLDNPFVLYACGNGVFKGVDDNWKEIAGTDILPVVTERIRGQADNDVFVVGDFGAVAHWNGISFQVYPEAATADIYYSCDYKKGVMVAVGSKNNQAIILKTRD